VIDSENSENIEAPVEKTRTGKKVLGLSFLVVIALACAAVFFMHPYRRAEAIAGDMLVRYAPPGTTVNGISVGFPLHIVLTNLSVPVQLQHRRRQLVVEKVSGNVSILSLLQGVVDVGMNADFFGGMLWLDLKTDAETTAAERVSSAVFFDARAREISLEQLCTFLESPIFVSGSFDADAEGELDERHLRTLNGKALVIGEDVLLPPLTIRGLILPENPNTEVTAKLSAGDGKVLVEKLRMNGSAYALSGNATVWISDPPESSPIHGSFSMVFNEAPIVMDKRLVESGARDLMDLVVSSGAEVFFKLDGTVEHPDVRLDPESSLNSMLQKSRR
jgi:type II secretion system protein N